MTSTGQSCPLCAQMLHRYLFNAEGDYIVNCSSLTCLYGVLHSRIYKAGSSCEEVQPVSAATVPSYDMPDFSTILNNEDDISAQVAVQNEVASLDHDLQAQFTLASKEDHSIDSWLQEFVNAPQDTTTASSIETISSYPPMDTSKQAQPMGKLAPRRTPKPVTPAASTTAVPAVRRSVREITVPEKTRNLRDLQKPKKITTKRASGGISALLKKTQEKAAILRAHVELTDETKSEAGSTDSGLQSDLSSSSSTNSADRRSGDMTTIQRLLHLEEAKKRSWGKTGMPGFRPSSTAAIPKLKLF